MASIGPTAPGTAVSDNSVGTFPWTSLSRITTADDNYVEASTSASGTRYSEYLTLTNFGFAVPAGATIDGVVLNIHRKYYAPSGGGCYDNIIHLVKSGSVTGDNRASLDAWSATEQSVAYGGIADTWNVALTVDDVNASTFGAAIQVYHISALMRNIMAQVDYVTMTVHYTAGAGPAASQTRNPIAMQPLMML